MFRTLNSAVAAVLLLASPAAAELELSFYLGTQTASDSTASGTLPDGTAFSRDVNWDGKSFDAPIYYGGRAMWWTASNLGFGIEGTHTKAYAGAADKAAMGFDRLEFTDGHNIFTANVMKRFPGVFGANSKFTPYGGAGIGVAIPHVDILATGATNRTYDYEMTGLALRGIAGMKYELTEDWALFGEYQIVWSDNDVTIDPDVGQPAGKLRTELVTHAVNVGISYSF